VGGLRIGQAIRIGASAQAGCSGVALRDVQDYARHRDPRTTRRYNRTG